MSPFVFALFLIALVSSTSGADVCSQPIVTGPCRAFIPSFGYKPSDKACVSFVYGGCQGNDNRFKTKEECEAKCLNQ